MKEKILVLEDERSLRTILCDNLKFDGYQVISASNGKEALILAAKERPDLAVIDVGLPDIDGWEVLRRMRKDPATEEMRVIMLSGNFGDEMHHLPEGIESSQLVAKPYEYSSLIELIQEILRRPTA